MTDGLFYAMAKGIFGDDDVPPEFNFNVEADDGTLLTFLERNPRVQMMCSWMAGQALKDGIKFAQPTIDMPTENDESVDTTNIMPTVSMPTEEFLETIHFMEKIKRAITLARCHRSSMVMMLDKSGNLAEAGTQYVDFEVYHRLANGNGWEVKKTDPKTGQPTIFKLHVKTEKMDEELTFDVDANRCVIFKNPKLGEAWDGTASTKTIMPSAALEELIITYAGKFALDRANSFLHNENVPNSDAATDIESAEALVPLKTLSTGVGITVTPKSFSATGSAGDYEIIINVLKKYMANAMQVSQSLMDGAAEGAGGSNTLSSSITNTLVSYSTIKEIQTHFKPYIEEVLKKLGMKNPNIEFIEPTPQLPKEGTNPIQDNKNPKSTVINSGK